MLGIGTLLSAVRNLATALQGLADTLTAANAGLRGKLALDEAEQLAAPPARRIIEEAIEPPSNGRRSKKTATEVES